MLVQPTGVGTIYNKWIMVLRGPSPLPWKKTMHRNKGRPMQHKKPLMDCFFSSQMLLGVDGHVYHGQFEEVPETNAARDALPYQSALRN